MTGTLQKMEKFLLLIVKREMDENNKDVIISSLRRKIRKLEEENKQLRNQFKINYIDINKNI